MASTDWAPHYVDRPVEHGAFCPCVKDEQATCNCYLSWSKEVLAATRVFQPATSDPPDYNGTFEDYERNAIQDFVDQKKPQSIALIKQRSASSELYQRLDQGEIRVLELHSDNLGTRLKGSLHIVNIGFEHTSRAYKGHPSLIWKRETNHAVSVVTGKPVWYSALSYTWGLGRPDQAIHFTEDKSVAITSSLEAALQCLRSNEHNVFLWIDQICTNQQDLDERAQQVSLMDLVYAHATNTIIWLGGEDGQEPGLAFETMEYVHARLQMTEAEITYDDFERLDFPPADHRSWEAIRQLFRRFWFGRLWTIQEAVLSRNAFLKCGEALACWEDMAAWCYVLRQCGLLRWLETGALNNVKSDPSCDKKKALSGASVIIDLEAGRLKAMDPTKEYLLNSLVQTRYAQASDARDKVYGVLGISESSIVADYSPGNKARDVYCEASRTQLPELIYELLSCVDHDNPIEPSWVPDWNTARVTETLGYTTKSWALYRCGWKPTTNTTAFTGRPDKVIVSADQRKVTMSGILFDKIAILGCVCENATLDIDDFQTGNKEWASYVQIIKNAYTDRKYPTPNISIYDAFWRTLLAGRDSTGAAAPTQDHSDVFSLILDSMTGQMPSLPGQIYSPRRQKGFFTLNSLRTRQPAKTLADLRLAIRSSLTMRRFAITQKGYFCLVPRGAREGDYIVVFDRACVPFVVRGTTSQEYELLGESYVHGIMEGEVMSMPDMNCEDITLV